MKVHLVKHTTIKKYIREDPRSRKGFDTWQTRLKAADWASPSDIFETFNDADLLGKGSYRVIFNIGGNKYRMICEYWFGKRMIHLYVCWIGNHHQYDQLCRSNMQYTIHKY